MEAPVPITHTIILLGGPGAHLDQVESSLLAEASNDRSNHTLTVRRDVPPLDRMPWQEVAAHALVIVSGGVTTKNDHGIQKGVTDCAGRIPIYFICDQRQGLFTDQAPVALHRLNALILTDEFDVRRACASILNLIGFDESERRVFISYARADGELRARELRRILIDHGWDVFLDQFGIPHGSDFQEELMRDLDGRSLLLLVETPMSPGRPWIEQEIAFAKQQSIGVMALSARREGDDIHPSIDNERRFRIVRPTPADHPLTPAETSQFVITAQRIHSNALRLRRESIINNAYDALDLAGYTASRLDEHAISAIRPGQRRVVIRATPFSPKPEDLLEVHRLRGPRRLRRNSEGWVVHPLITLEDERSRLLRWLCKRRSLEVFYTGELTENLR